MHTFVEAIQEGLALFAVGGLFIFTIMWPFVALIVGFLHVRSAEHFMKFVKMVCTLGVINFVWFSLVRFFYYP